MYYNFISVSVFGGSNPFALWTVCSSTKLFVSFELNKFQRFYFVKCGGGGSSIGFRVDLKYILRVWEMYNQVEWKQERSNYIENTERDWKIFSYITLNRIYQPLPAKRKGKIVMFFLCNLLEMVFFT